MREERAEGPGGAGARPMTPGDRRRVWAVIVATQLVLALVTGVGVYVGYHHIDTKVQAGEQIHHHAKRRAPALPTSALNILVMGSDTRSCAGCAIDNETGEGGSDTTILVHVADGRRSAYAISIPRDTLVDRPDCTRDGRTIPGAHDVMWNQAYTVGGPECTVEQLEAVTGIYVDDYITINFGGFKDMVDAIGGVEVCIPKPIDDPIAHIHFNAGTQKLDGARSLQYVRERHSTANSDLGRMKRQQAFIASMINKVESAGTLTRPDRLLRFANALAGSIKTSPDLAGAGQLVKLASSLRNADLPHIKFVTAPTVAFPEGSPNWGRLRFTPEAEQLWHRVKDDEPLGKFGRGAITAKNPHGSRKEAAANGLCA